MPPLLSFTAACKAQVLMRVYHGPRPAQALLDRLYAKQFFIEELEAIKRGWLRISHPILLINTLMVT